MCMHGRGVVGYMVVWDRGNVMSVGGARMFVCEGVDCLCRVVHLHSSYSLRHQSRASTSLVL